jgi:hypothetical protein
MAANESDEMMGPPDLDESDETLELDEPQPGEETKDEPPGKEGAIKSPPGLLKRQKWILPSVFGSIVLIVLLNLAVGSKSPIIQERKTRGRSPETRIEENWREERLLPFFIPLPPDAPNSVVRVDIAALWGGLTSVLYRKKELQIRDRLYRHMLMLVREQRDFEKETNLLESEMMKIFQEFLGLGALEIKVREITYF